MSNFCLKNLFAKHSENSKQSNLANYKPFVISNNLVFISGQLPIEREKSFTYG